MLAPLLLLGVLGVLIGSSTRSKKGGAAPRIPQGPPTLGPLGQPQGGVIPGPDQKWAFMPNQSPGQWFPAGWPSVPAYPPPWLGNPNQPGEVVTLPAGGQWTVPGEQLPPMGALAQWLQSQGIQPQGMGIP